MLRTIYKLGEPVLEQVAEPVPDEKFGSDELKQLIGDMFETMYDAQGVGLAAPQIGLGQRIFVVDPTGGEDQSQQLAVINPEILDTAGTQTGEEGCLSIPGFRGDVTRANRVRIRARDVDGSTYEIEGEELLARAILHENDHLDGILFLKYLSALKREMIKRKIKKLQKRGEW